MSHLTGYKSYDGSTKESQILRDLNSFAYNPQESSGYHGNLTFHKNTVYKDRNEAVQRLKDLVKESYDDHAVLYTENGKEYWLVKYEYHC
jgi:hypothetical protein